MSGLVEDVSKKLVARGWMLVTAESCTGGMIAAAMTDRAGSSKVFERGFVTYSNAAKMDSLGVSFDVLQEHGAVSDATARAMAQGALKNSLADIAVSVTGVAGPDGGSALKPVGLVYIGVAGKDFVESHEFRFSGGRDEIRRQSVDAALNAVLKAL